MANHIKVSFKERKWWRFAIVWSKEARLYIIGFSAFGWVLKLSYNGFKGIDINIDLETL